MLRAVAPFRRGRCDRTFPKRALRGAHGVMFVPPLQGVPAAESAICEPRGLFGEATFQSLGEIPPKEISLKTVSEKRQECRFSKSVPADRHFRAVFRRLARRIRMKCGTRITPCGGTPLGAAAQKEHAPERRNFYCGDGSPRDVGCSGRLRLSGAVDVTGLSPSARFAARMGLCLFRPSGAFSCRIRNLRAPRPFWGSDIPVAC